MTVRLVDFSWDKPNGHELKAEGFSGVVWYVSGDAGKDMSKAQTLSYLADGLAAGFVAEGTGREALSNGLVTEAVRGDRIMTSYGAPVMVVEFVAVDFNPTGAELPVIAGHVHDARMAVKRPVGVYGSYGLLKYLFDHKVIDWGWQTYAWSNGHLDPRAQYYQYSNGHHTAGGTVDYDIQEHSGGLWLPVVPPVKPPKPPVVHPPAYPGRLLQKTTSTHVDPAVKTLQGRLNTVEHAGLVVDGVFGAFTEAAVKSYQRSKHLTVDGIVGPVTWRSLFS